VPNEAAQFASCWKPPVSVGIVRVARIPADRVHHVRAPDTLRRETAGKTQITLARQLAALRPRRLEGPEDALRHTLRTLAKRWQ